MAKADMNLDINIVDVNEDEINFTVMNNSTSEVRYIGIRVQKEVNGNWIYIRADTDCPCMSKCKKRIIPLEAKTIRKHSWDRKNNQCDDVKKGIYRIVISGSWHDETNFVNELGKSDSFQIDK